MVAGRVPHSVDRPPDVDLGQMGVADRWAVLDAYGTGPDDERTSNYRVLWELDP